MKERQDSIEAARRVKLAAARELRAARQAEEQASASQHEVDLFSEKTPQTRVHTSSPGPRGVVALVFSRVQAPPTA